MLGEEQQLAEQVAARGLALNACCSEALGVDHEGAVPAVAGREQAQWVQVLDEVNTGRLCEERSQRHVWSFPVVRTVAAWISSFFAT